MTRHRAKELGSRSIAVNAAARLAVATDPGAGTYAQLVKAAESCQVSIIHPSQPRIPNEPRLDELLVP